MQKYSLEIDDFLSNDYTLIGIHSILEDYKLAYLLNQQLNIQFSRAHYDLDFHNEKNNAIFPLYQYINEKLDHEWYLISNVFKEKSTPIEKGLFKESDTITYLISEKKKVDFFIKLEGNFDEKMITQFVEIINNIKQVITSYIIETDSLKSKEFLIF